MVVALREGKFTPGFLGDCPGSCVIGDRLHVKIPALASKKKVPVLLPTLHAIIGILLPSKRGG